MFRPLTLGELLDRSFSLYRHHFWLFVGIMALPSLLALAFGLVVAVFAPQPVSPSSVTPDTRPAELIGAMVWFVGAVLGVGVIYFLAHAVALGATTVAVSHLYMERPTSVRGSYTPLTGRVGRLALLMVLVSLRLVGVFILGFLVAAIAGGLSSLVSTILSVLVLFVGFGLAFLLAAWVGLRYAVSIPVAVLEDQTARQSIRRSIHLTRGSLWRVFALTAFAMVITYAVLALFQGPFMAVGAMTAPEAPTFFWINLAGTVSGAIGGALTSPLMIVAFAVLYYDLRVRKEGLDLELMLAGLDRDASLPAPSSAVLPG